MTAVLPFRFMTGLLVCDMYCWTFSTFCICLKKSLIGLPFLIDWVCAVVDCPIPDYGFIDDMCTMDEWPFLDCRACCWACLILRIRWPRVLFSWVLALWPGCIIVTSLLAFFCRDMSLCWDWAACRFSFLPGWYSSWETLGVVTKIWIWLKRSLIFCFFLSYSFKLFRLILKSLAFILLVDWTI